MWRRVSILRSECRRAMSSAAMPSEKPAVSSAFSRAKCGVFYQEQPELRNPYVEDPAFQRYLRRLLSPEVYTAVAEDLTSFGERIVNELDRLGRECELNLPKLRTFDAYGRRVDELITCEAWRRMKGIAAEEGLVAIGYARNSANQYNRLHQTAKLLLYAPSAGLYSCPLSMTDGAAKTIRELTDKGHVSPSIQNAYERVTSRDPTKFWTSGQWMTEKRGGSDVALGTETVAIPRPDGKYSLYGYKFFSSATDADMTFTLARMLNENGSPIMGTRGLACFFLHVRDPTTGTLNNIEIARLKDKLGTKQVPTAELLLDGAIAEKVTEEGRGVAMISNMLNITRLHNAIAAAGGMRRMVQLARDYAHKRHAFGKKLIDHPLHVQTLARMEIDTRAAQIMVLEVARLLGLQEHHLASEKESIMLRLLTPLLKLYTAKMAIATISEGLECFGGLGYMEDSGLPSALRDAQVLSIWEGTTNVLSLDILRVLAKQGPETLAAFRKTIATKLQHAGTNPQLEQTASRLSQAADEIVAFARHNATSATAMEMAARDFAYSLSRIIIGSLLTEHASWSNATPDDIETAIRWCNDQSLVCVNTSNHAYTSKMASSDQTLVLSGYKQTSKL